MFTTFIRQARALTCIRGCRYFSNTELRDLFAVDEEGLNKSETSAQLAVLHGADRAYTAEVTKHLAKVRCVRTASVQELATILRCSGESAHQVEYFLAVCAVHSRRS